MFGWLIGTADFSVAHILQYLLFFLMGKAVEKACDYGWKTAVRHIQ